jgi:amino acid permease
MTPPGEVHLIKFTPSFISTFPIQVFAFTCSQNVKITFFFDTTSVTDFRGGQLFPIFNEVKSNSQKRMNIIIGTAIGSATLTYEIIAVFGYLTFGSHVRSPYS